MRTRKITYNDLFDKLDINATVNRETVYDNIHNIKIKNDKEYVDIEAFVKKPKMKIIGLELSDGNYVKCAEKHILLDENNNKVFAKDAKIIQTVNGPISINNIEYIKDDEVYDIALPYPHIYTTTNGIKHHNTKLIDEYLNYLLNSDLVQEKLEAKKEQEKRNERESQPKGVEVQDWLESIEDRVNDMFDNDEIAVVYVKNENVLSTDEFWNQLKSSEYQLVILDDLDYALLPRTQAVSSGEDVSKNAFISQLLSFTDGIFENGNNTKFIITTNRDVSEIDTAVLRKGRTFDILNLRYLTPAESLVIWTDEYNLEKEEFMKIFGDRTEIPASDLGAYAKDLISARAMGVQTKPYILEDGISQYKTLKTETKIGML